MSAQHELPGPPLDCISRVSFSATSAKLAVSSWDRTVTIYQHTPADASAPFTRVAAINFRAPVLDVCWGADEETLYAVGLDQDVRQLTLGSDEQVVLSTHGAASNKIAYSRDHGLVISISWEGIMHVHLLATKSFIRVRLPAKPYALALTTSRVVVAMAERKVAVYDLATLQALIISTYTPPDGPPPEVLDLPPWQQRESSLKFMTRAVACMPDGLGFATSSIEGRVSVEYLDPLEQKRTYAFKCHRQTRPARADEQEPAQARSPSQLADPAFHESTPVAVVEQIDEVYPVNALAFHPQHGTFATGGGDGVVALWDAQSKRRVRQYNRLASSVATLEFSGDGRFLAAGVDPGLDDSRAAGRADVSKVRVVVRVLGGNEARGRAGK
ncbi:hypothetical protein LTR08_005420 [Meristemomyces frigidus]|nr:hypothetical protein LTR08_005420 [Meristemomyces frigidus]